jgi:poly(beta-D-mannuronate) lyase
MQIVVRNQGEKHHIHHNHFIDIPEGKSSNGYETVQLITERNPFDPDPGACGTVIEYNLFERCNGEAEVISVKSNGNTLRRNTFRDCRGGLVLRHGDSNTVSESFFLGDNEPRAGGVRLQGEDQIVINNTFRSLKAYGVSMMDGTPDDLYIRTQRALIAFNTFAGCSPALVVGLNHSKHPNGTPPKDCVIANNAFILSTSDTPDSDLKTVRLVQNDEPVNWTWEGNITDGDLGMSARDGIKIGRPELDYLPNGIVTPAETSELIGNAEGNYPNITTDALGHSRGDRKTIGCVEFPAQLEDGGPLTAADVGPE